MIQDFENWSSKLGEMANLSDLAAMGVGIEASDYLATRILHRAKGKEPLVPALGGLPLAMREHVTHDIALWQFAGLKPFFVFSGIDVSKREDPFRQRQQGVEINTLAWQLYGTNNAQEAVEKFGESTYVTPEDLYRGLQAILNECHIPWLIAPYSAWPQLAELKRSGHIQAVAGSSELLLYDVDRVITSWDLQTSGTNTFQYVVKDKFVNDMKKATNIDVSNDMFVDACILAGTHFLPTIPSLDASPRKGIKPLSAIDMMMNYGRTGIAVCQNYQDQPSFQRTNYVDRYRRARLAVKHQPVIRAGGKVEPMAQGELSEDAHEFIGQRLPDEIYHYLSRGLINARLLSWRTTSEIIESQPLDGGDAPEYQNLVSSKLTPLRTTAIKLLSSALHNWYQHKDLTLKCWFNSPNTTTISMSGGIEPKPLVQQWNVKSATYQKGFEGLTDSGAIAKTISSLRNAEFAKLTVSNIDARSPLVERDEIMNNTLWRFFALREYVDTNHNLTKWGQVLATITEKLKGTEYEETAIVAVELLRLGVLNADYMFTGYEGAPLRGDEKDRSYNLLISRVAGLGKLHHNQIGFTGPLSHHLLAYTSMINVVRSSLRDLVDVSITQMFLTGAVKRDIDNNILQELTIALPFLVPGNCALSVAVKSYLDELPNRPNPLDPTTREAVKNMAATTYFPQSVDLKLDFESAFKIWDAVFAGVQVAEGLLSKDLRNLFVEADKWLSVRR